MAILVNGKGYNENKEKLIEFAEAHDISYCFLKTCNGVELKDSTGEDSIYLNFGRILVDESSKPYKGDIDTSVCCLVNDQLVYKGACARDKSNRIKVYDDEHSYSVDIEGDIRYISNLGRYEKRWIVDADENVIGLMFSFVG